MNYEAINKMVQNAIISGTGIVSVDPSRFFLGYTKKDPLSNRSGMAVLAQHIETASGRQL